MVAELQRILHGLGAFQYGTVVTSAIEFSQEERKMCEACTYPDAPCRFPGTLHASIEGYGVFVDKLARQAGMNDINGENTVTFFGSLLFGKAANP